MKKCSNIKCESKGKLMPLSEFYERKAMKDGYEARCKKCRLIYDRERLRARNDHWLKMIIG